jgi:hypothetical protein
MNAMPNTLWRALGLVLVLSQPHAGYADRAPGKREFNVLYSRLSSLFAHRDRKGVAALIRTDFVYEARTSRSLTRNEFLNSAFALLKQVKAPRDVETIDSITILGNTASMNVHEVFTGRIDLGDKKRHVWKQTASSTDTWIRARGNWLLKRIVLYRSARFLDGKPSAPIGQVKQRRPRAIPPNVQ